MPFILMRFYMENVPVDDLPWEHVQYVHGYVQNLDFYSWALEIPGPMLMNKEIKKTNTNSNQLSFEFFYGVMVFLILVFILIFQHFTHPICYYVTFIMRNSSRMPYTLDIVRIPSVQQALLLQQTNSTLSLRNILWGCSP